MNNAKTQIQTFSTHDLDLAAVLVTSDVKLLDVTRNGDRRAYFHFDDAERCEAIRHDFLCGELQANALDLLRNLRTLKYRVHQV